MGSDKLDNIIGEIERFSVPEGKSKAWAWEQLQDKIKQQAAPKGKARFMWTKVQMGIAASFILLISVYSLLNMFSDTSIITEKGQHLVYFLPDSSKVTLNADSKITFNIKDWESDRIVSLEGEAFFEVKKGSKFEVISNQGIVAVLGTSFNIYAREDNYKVACLTGKVKVSTAKNANHQVLTPGFRTSIVDNIVNKPTKLSKGKKAYSWIDNEFYFEEISLAQVIQEIERQYNMGITIPDHMKQRKYTGYFDTKDIKNTLDKVCLPMGLKYNIVDKRVVIVSVQ